MHQNTSGKIPHRPTHNNEKDSLTFTEKTQN